MSEDFQLLSLKSYETLALRTDRRSDGASLSFPLLGLFGETGSLLSEVKKKQRDRKSYRGYAGAVVEELGDVLWYLAAVASRGGFSIEEIVARSNAPYDGGRDELTFAELQPAIMTGSLEPTAAFESTLLQLAGEVGLLIADHQAGRLAAGGSTALRGHLSGIFATLTKAANEAGVTLEAAAIKNLAKIFDRWPQERTFPPLPDEGFPDQEILPRKLTIEIVEREVNGRVFVYQSCNGVNLGDRLTDNAMVADDYRFHDVFHFAHMAVLGWSPVMRSMLGVKRKSDPKIDEVQDGARAILIEEGVTTWIFGQALELDFFSGLGVGDLPFDLLKHIRQFVLGYEAEDCPLWAWEEAILQGFSAFRFLREHRRGRLQVDMVAHTLTIEKLP